MQFFAVSARIQWLNPCAIDYFQKLIISHKYVTFELLLNIQRYIRWWKQYKCHLLLYNYCYNFHTAVKSILVYKKFFFTIIHIPSLSLPSRFKTPIFCIAERSRSIVRWLTDKVSDICLPVIVGDILMRLRIFCWRSVSFVSDISPSRSPTFGVTEEAKMMVWNWSETRVRFLSRSGTLWAWLTL